MKLFRCFLMLIILSMAMFSIAPAQEDVLRPKGKPGGYAYLSKGIPIMIGIEAGMNLNMFSADMSWDPPYENSAWRVYESGFGISPYFAGLVDFSFSNNFGLQVKVAADMKSISNTQGGEAEDVSFGLPCGLEFDYTETGVYLGISALLRLNLEKLVILFGPIIQAPIGDFEQEFNAKTTYGDCYFYDDFGNPYTSYSETYSGEALTRYGLEFGVGYMIPLSSRFRLVPQVRFQFMLSKYGEDRTDIWDRYLPWTAPNMTMESINQTMHSIQFTVALWFEI